MPAPCAPLHAAVLRPAVTAASTWAEVQARIPADAAARLEAVPDRRRVELFNVYVAQVGRRFWLLLGSIVERPQIVVYYPRQKCLHVCECASAEDR